MSAGWVEEFGCCGNGGESGFGVAGEGADRAVVGLSHDHGGVSAVLAEVGGCGVAELVELESGVVLDEGAGAVIAQAHPVGFGADVSLGCGGSAGGAGPAFGAEDRP